MKVQINCRVSMPQALVSDIMEQFGLTAVQGVLTISEKDFRVMETILTDFIVLNRVQKISKNSEEMLQARLESLVSLARLLPMSNQPYTIQNQPLLQNNQIFQQPGQQGQLGQQPQQFATQNPVQELLTTVIKPPVAEDTKTIQPHTSAMSESKRSKLSKLKVG